MPNTSHVVTLCLPENTPTEHLAAVGMFRAAAACAATRTTPIPRFMTHANRRQQQHLIHPVHGMAAGGPINLLQVDAMRAAAHHSWWRLWLLWQQVVQGSRPARPYWTFADRLRHNRGYTLARARVDYLSQPRVAAMNTYNALPHRLATLPTAHLEALQAGHNAYAYLGWLYAIPGHRFVTITGHALRPATARYCDLLDHLLRANAHLEQLRQDDRLLALADAGS